MISDELTRWFTGQHVTEAGAAGLTGMIDIHTLQWIPEICAHTHLDLSCFARIARAGTDLGPVLPAVAEEFGLPKECRFVVGALDQFTGAIGAGNIAPGTVSETTGTALATVRCSENFDPNLPPAVFQGPAHSPGLYYRMAFGSVSANLLEWYRNALPDRPDYDQLTREAAKVAPGAEGLKLEPKAELGDLKDGFANATNHHARGHYTRCILEAVAFALAEQVRQVCGQDHPAEIYSCGGAARSELWLQIKADVLGIPFRAMSCDEPTSLGAAMLAARALGWGDLPSLASRWCASKAPHLPGQQAAIYRTLAR